MLSDKVQKFVLVFINVQARTNKQKTADQPFVANCIVVRHYTFAQLTNIKKCNMLLFLMRTQQIFGCNCKSNNPKHHEDNNQPAMQNRTVNNNI